MSNTTKYGLGSLEKNTGNNNTAIGAYAAYNNLDASNNTAIGSNSAFFNTTGSNNTSLGAGSICNNTTGALNTAIGSSALEGPTGSSVGNQNTAVGAQSLYTNRGSLNTAIGTYSALGVTGGNYNTFLGANTSTLNDINCDYSTAIGYNAKIDASNQIMMGGTGPAGYPNLIIPGNAYLPNFTVATSGDQIVPKSYIDHLVGAIDPGQGLNETTNGINTYFNVDTSLNFINFLDSTSGVTGANGNLVLGAYSNNTIIGPTGGNPVQFQSQIQAQMGITGPTGSFTFISSSDGITGPTGSFTNLISSNDTYLATSTSTRLGVGTTNPSATLDVSGNAIISGTLNIDGSIIGPTGSFTFISSSAGITGPTGSFTFISASDGITGPTGSFTNLTSSNNTFLATTTNTRLGVGTTNPSATLDVSGNAIISGTLNIDESIIGTTGSFTFISSSAGITGPTGSFTFISASDGITGPTGSFTNLISSNDTYLATTTNTRLGVGTTNPSATLDVSGNAIISGTLNIDESIIGTTGSFTFISSSAGITGPTGSFTFISASDGITGPTGSFTNLISSNDTYLATTTNTRLGVGTTNPSATLDVSGNMSINGSANFIMLPTYAGSTEPNGNPSPPPQDNQLITKKYADNTYGGAITNLLSSNNTWTGVNTFENNTYLATSTNTRLGIGTTGPSATLDVSGNALISGTLGVNGTITGPTGSFTFISSSAGITGPTGSFTFLSASSGITGPTGSFTFLSSTSGITGPTGSFTFLSASQGIIGDISGNATNITITSDDSSGNYFIPFSKTQGTGSKQLFQDDTTGPLVYNPSFGRLGIGIANPSTALDVSGNALISGTLGVNGTITGPTGSFTFISSSAGITGPTGSFTVLNTPTITNTSNTTPYRITATDRIYQQLGPDPSYNAVNNYYGLAKDAYPLPSPYSAGVKAVSTWNGRNTNTNAWWGLCWAPELTLFVAVSTSGTSNRVMTSSTGVTWTTQTSTVDNAWRSVCWAPELSRFVAVASTGSTNNRVMYSSNGTSWSNSSISGVVDSGWYSVCWSSELRLFVAVAFDGADRVMTSPNGINWTARTAAAASQWYSVCWAPELSLFVAVSDSPTKVMTSSDGITWTASSSISTDGDWVSVCWSPELGLFATCSYDASVKIATSPDGINWTIRSTPAGNYVGICWAAELGLFVAVNDDVAGTNKVITSPDGINWTLRTAPANQYRTIAWAPELGIFAATAYNGSGIGVMTSSFGGRPPTSYNVFDSPFNSTDLSGNWTFSRMTISNNLGAIPTLDVRDTTSNQGAILLIPNCGLANYNPGVRTNDKVITTQAAGAVSARQMFLTINDGPNTGVRIASNLVTMGAGGFGTGADPLTRITTNGATNTIDISGQTIDITGSQINLDAATIDFQNTTTTTSSSANTATIQSTSSISTNNFLKVKLNNSFIWIPYFTTDPSL